MYEKVRKETRDGDGEAKEKMRSELGAWGFDEEKDLQALDSETRSEIKAVLRAMKEVLKD